MVFAFASVQTKRNTQKPKKTRYKKHHRANIIKDRGRRKEAGWRAENGVPTMTHQFSLREQVPVRPRHAHQGPDGKQGSFVCFSSPSLPPSQAPMPDPNPMFRRTRSLGPIT